MQEGNLHISGVSVGNRAISRRVVELLLNHGVTTRQEVFDCVQMPLTTVCDTLRRMVKAGILEEPDRRGKKPGRRASPIQFRKDFGYFIGLEVDAMTTSAVCLNANGHEVASVLKASPLSKNAEVARQEVLDVMEGIKKQLGQDWTLIRGLGFGDPGLVDIERGVSVHTTLISGWSNFESRKWLNEQFGFPVWIYPGSALRAYVEWIKSTPHTQGGLFNINLDFGIGGGFTKGGAMFIGDSFCGMEIGHIVVQPDGPMCSCGNRGCLEALIGLTGLQKQIQEILDHGVQTELRAKNFSIPHFVSCTRHGDKVACSMTQTICEYIGSVLTSVVAILNPQVIVFSGQLSELRELLLPRVREYLQVHCLHTAVKNLELRVSNLSETSAAFGGAWVVRHEILSSFFQTKTLKVSSKKQKVQSFDE